jgi:hypothetical protein
MRRIVIERNESLRTYLGRKLESVPVGATIQRSLRIPRPCTERRESTNRH